MRTDDNMTVTAGSWNPGLVPCRGDTIQLNSSGANVTLNNPYPNALAIELDPNAVALIIRPNDDAGTAEPNIQLIAVPTHNDGGYESP